MSLIQILEALKGLSPDEIVYEIRDRTPLGTRFKKLSADEPFPEGLQGCYVIIEQTPDSENEMDEWEDDYGSNDEGVWYWEDFGDGYTPYKSDAHQFNARDVWSRISLEYSTLIVVENDG